MTKHSTLVGGSTAERVINCPGSVGLSATLPPAPSSDAADKGSMLHEAMTLILDDKIKELDELIGFEAYGHTLTKGDLEDLVKPALAAFDKLDQSVGGIEFEIETKVSFGDALPGAFGTGDVIGESKTHGHVIDWKFGYNPVSADGNSQGQYYACAARHTKAVADLLPRGKPVMISIIQPQAHGDEADSWTVDHEALDKFELQLKNATRKALKPDAHLEVGDWCKFCPAKPICPLKNEVARDALGVDIGKLDAENVSGATLGGLKEMADELEDWIAGVNALIKGALEMGMDGTGYKLVAGNARRVMREEDAIKFFKMKRIPQKTYFVRKLLSLKEAEKLVGKDAVDGLCDKKPGNPIVVPESDKRPAILPGGEALKELAGKLG